MQKMLLPLFFMVLWTVSSGQLPVTIIVDSELLMKKDYRDSTTLFQEIQALQVGWINKGFYFTGIDSVAANDDKELTVFLHKGEKMKSETSGLNKKPLLRQIDRKLDYFGNSGFPFATLRLDSLHTSNGDLTGLIKVDPGPEIKYDSATFSEDIKTNSTFVFQLLDIAPGALFSEKAYSTIGRKFDRSSFLTLNKPPDISFQKNKATIYLDVSEDVSNSFQGIVGLQESSTGKSAIIGSLALDVENLFQSGKQLSVHWERFAQESQNLNLSYKHPFLLGMPLTPSVELTILKQDTTFLTRGTKLGLLTYISPRTSLLIQYDGVNGSLISAKQENLVSKGLADFKRNSYEAILSNGLKRKLGQAKEGVFWKIGACIGTKKVTKNAALSDAYYDSIALSTNFYRADLHLMGQKRIKKNLFFFQDVQGGALENNEILTNELYRLGGLSTIRGFNEKTFFAKRFGMVRSELRSFFESQSYAYLFFDQLIYQRARASEYVFGTGLGFVLATLSGQFSFALSVGQSDNQQISFNELRAHFGYVSRF